jgi:hypothetical protein
MTKKLGSLSPHDLTIERYEVCTSYLCNQTPENWAFLVRYAGANLLAAAKIVLEHHVPKCCMNSDDRNWHREGCGVPMLLAAIAEAEGKVGP